MCRTLLHVMQISKFYAMSAQQTIHSPHALFLYWTHEASASSRSRGEEPDLLVSSAIRALHSRMNEWRSISLTCLRILIGAHVVDGPLYSDCQSSDCDLRVSTEVDCNIVCGQWFARALALVDSERDQTTFDSLCDPVPESWGNIKTSKLCPTLDSSVLQFAV